MKKKIAIIHDKLNLGGTEKALVTMLKFLDYQKLDVTLWLMDGTGLLQSQIDPHVKVNYFSNSEYDGKGLLKYYIQHFQIARLIRSLQYRKQSRESMDSFEDNLKYHIYSLPLLTEEEYDCVIVYQGLYMQLLAAALGRIRAKKKAAWIHMRFHHTEKQAASFREEYKVFDRIFCVSKDLQKHFVNHYGMREKTITLYNLFDQDEIRKQSEESIDGYCGNDIILCTVGRIAPEKGQMMIPDIVRNLRNSGFDFTWLVLGDGQQKEDLQNKINEYELGNIAILLGNVANPYPYIKNCDVYVQPSLSEGFCTSTMEAKILGKPIVTTNVADINEQFINGFDALIVNSFDPDAIAEEIKKLMCSYELRQQLSRNTLQHMEVMGADSLNVLYEYLGE